MENEIINHALIMAAGRGNRMRPLTDTLPKSLIPYNGDTLIGHSLKELQGYVQYIHITVGYKKAMLSEYLLARGVDTIINTEGHGNAWWITNTLMRNLDEPVLVLTTDNITEIDLDFLTKEYSRLGNPYCMLVPVKPIKGILGDFIFHQKEMVIALDRNRQSDIYCSGIQVLNPNKIFQSLAEAPEDFNNIWNGLISINQLKVANLYPKTWFSVDTLEQALGLNK